MIVPLPLQGLSNNIWSNEKKLSMFLASSNITNTDEAPCLSKLYLNRSALILFISQAVIFASLLESAAICVVFPPGAAVISKISFFGIGFNTIGGNIEDKLCKYIFPFLYISISCISFSFLFNTIKASLLHFTLSYFISFFINSCSISSAVVFIVFTRNDKILFVLYPSNILITSS